MKEKKALAPCTSVFRVVVGVDERRRDKALSLFADGGGLVRAQICAAETAAVAAIVGVSAFVSRLSGKQVRCGAVLFF